MKNKKADIPVTLVSEVGENGESRGDCNKYVLLL